MNEKDRRPEPPSGGDDGKNNPNTEKLSVTAAVYEDGIGEYEDAADSGGEGAAAALEFASKPSLLEIGLAASQALRASVTPARAVDEDRGLSFEQIHRKYETKIYNLILRMVGDREDAEDLTVETFLNAYRAWGRFRGDARVSTWLHQIAVNNCKNRFKQKDRRREREPVSLDDGIDTDTGEMSREVADWRHSPELRLMDQELAKQIQKAVDALAPEYRTVLVLAQMEELSYEEVAQITGLSVPAVKTRLHRARNMMRRRLEPYYRGWSGKSEG